MGFSQKLDSLKTRAKMAHGSALCSTYYQIGYELVDVDHKLALNYAKKCRLCAKQVNDTLQLVRGAHLEAMAFRRLGEIDSSNSIIVKILPIARRKFYHSELTDLLHGLALGLLFKAEFDQALRYNFEALELRRQYSSAFQVGSTLFNIGFVYYKLADYNKALDYYRQSLEMLRSEPRDGHLIARLLGNIALSYAYSGNTTQAEHYVKEALSQCGSNCLEDDLANLDFCNGIIWLERGDSTIAKSHFLKSYQRAFKYDYKRLGLDNIIYLSKICLGTKDLEEAEYFLTMAEGLIQEGVPYSMELMKVYHEFASFYERKGDYKKVVSFQRRYIALKDSIYDDEVTTSLMRIEAAHVEKDKNAEIELQTKMLSLNEEIISRQRIATILAVTTAVLLVAVVFLLVRDLHKNRLENEDLEKRVRARTGELEGMVSQLHRWVDEKKIWMGKILYSVKHTTNTIEGLSSLAAMDPESTAKCVELIDREMKQLLIHVNSYAARSDSAGDDFANSR